MELKDLKKLNDVDLNLQLHQFREWWMNTIDKQSGLNGIEGETLFPMQSKLSSHYAQR